MPHRCLSCSCIFPDSDRSCPGCGSTKWRVFESSFTPPQPVLPPPVVATPPPVSDDVAPQETSGVDLQPEPLRIKLCPQCNGTRCIKKVVARSWRTLFFGSGTIDVPCDVCDGIGRVKGTPEEVREFVEAKRQAAHANEVRKQKLEDQKNQRRAILAAEKAAEKRRFNEEIERRAQRREATEPVLRHFFPDGQCPRCRGYRISKGPDDWHCMYCGYEVKYPTR